MAFGNTRIEHCPVTQANLANVTIDPRLKEQLLVALYGWKDEFILFLQGEKQGRNVHITGVRAPEQYNGPSTCESVEKFDPERDLGIMHSHVNFGAFHSCTDEQGVDNAPVSLVISRKSGGDLAYEICGKVAVDLPCGSAGILKANVEFGAPGEPLTEWKAPVAYTLADAIKSDCAHAYKEVRADQPILCEVRHLVERDFALFNQISNNTKTRVYTSTYNQNKGGVSASESNSGAGKKWGVEHEWDRTVTTDGKRSARKPDGQSGRELLVLPENAHGTLGQGDFAYVKCSYCDEDMFAYEAYVVEKYYLCYWCNDYLMKNTSAKAMGLEDYLDAVVDEDIQALY